MRLLPPSFFICCTFSLCSTLGVSARDHQACSCGFYDALSQQLFTESVIVYFNESTALPLDFVREDYEHRHEKDWNALYVQGADPSNVQLNESHALDLHLSPPTETHLVRGAGLRTSRRDIQYGSFRALMRSPPPDIAGSALSMMWKYNETQQAELSVMNTDSPAKAWVGTFVNGEFTTRSLGANFSDLIGNASANRNYTVFDGVMSNGSVNPWGFTEYRVDWTPDAINFYIGGNCTRTIEKRHKSDLASVPAPFYFKHWSTGNRYSMAGPPFEPSIASIGWIRLFFNSSSMTDDQRSTFSHCSVSDACSTDDITLRASTPYTDGAGKRWKQANIKSARRVAAIWLSVLCIAFSSVLLLHAFLRRTSWKALPGRGTAATIPHSDISSLSAGTETPPVISRPRASSDHGPRWHEPRDDLAIEQADPSPGTSVFGGATGGSSTRCGEASRAESLRFNANESTVQIGSSYSSLNNTVDDFPFTRHFENITASRQEELDTSESSSDQTLAAVSAAGRSKIDMATVTQSEMPAPRMRPHPPPPRQRIDHLAGIVAFCAIIVTVMHFGLTYVPAIVIPGAPYHHKSEYWVQKTISPFLLNQMWLGVFFTTSTRFLVARYLKAGDLKDIAQAAVRRTPRLMIPVAAMAMFEYFLVDCGVTKYLQYVPSLSWSTWPYVSRFPTVGHFVSEVLELVYLVPNAVPQITFNYCTGVLWTIAVQLQGSWLVLIGVVVVREMKTAWKRFGFYIFCLVNHWYAQSWGAYLWFGLLLADLDITYEYRPWLYRRPAVYYAVILLAWLCVAAGFAANVVPNWATFDFGSYENNIHPDWTTGDAIGSTANAGYPSYYVPRLNGFFFAAGMQLVTELSPAVQWFLSLPPFLAIFPHIFSIYLLHGLVFWSWGSWLMVVLASRGLGYSTNVAIVGVTSYALLFSILPIVTPIIEALGNDITALVWTSATEKSPARRPTLFPFPGDLFERRTKSPGDAAVGMENGTAGTAGRGP